MKQAKFILKMAFRDSRRSRRRLLLASLSMVFGVAALVAVRTFGEDLETALSIQSRSLLGADLRARGRSEFDPEATAVLEDLAAKYDANLTRRISFSTLALFPASGGTRLLRVRAAERDFPFYGELETVPEDARHTYLDGAYALVDDSVLHQFDAKVGDELKIGEKLYTIAGRLLSIPGEAATSALFGPRVYVPRDQLDESLLVRGSRVTYDLFFQFSDGEIATIVAGELERNPHTESLDIDTADEVQRDFGRLAEDLQSFLGLVGFVALLLGGLGVASAIHVYGQQKLETAAVLRCLGAPTVVVLNMFLVQALALGALSALVGAGLGSVLARAIPRLLAEFLPFTIESTWNWGAITWGFLVSLTATLCFALLPLSGLRNVAPIRALHSAFRPQEAPKDPMRRFLWLVALLIIFGLAWSQAREFKVALGFVGGIALTFAILLGISIGLRRAVKRLITFSWPFTLRQGFANLHRPQNQTTSLMLCIGLGVMLLQTVELTRHGILNGLEVTSAETQANLVLFDIQSSDRDAVEGTVRKLGFPVIETVPIVSMRLKSLKGRSVEELRDIRDDGISGWALTREYRSTYRSEINESEQLLEGEWVGEHDPNQSVVAISVEQRQAERLTLELGDRLVFDVQGVPVETEVRSIRQVEWREAKPNFFVVFPSGALEQAPQFHVLLTNAPTAEESARLQRALVLEYPGISAVDVTMLLSMLDQVLDQVSFVIQFMALFSVLTGAVVLLSAIFSSRKQRVEESVLLRTLGAKRQQVLRVLLAEYGFLGMLATLSGTVLAFAASAALLHWVFRANIGFDLSTPAWIAGGTFLFVVLMGFLASLSVTRASPLAVLRREG